MRAESRNQAPEVFENAPSLRAVVVPPPIAATLADTKTFSPVRVVSGPRVATPPTVSFATAADRIHVYDGGVPLAAFSQSSGTLSYDSLAALTDQTFAEHQTDARSVSVDLIVIIIIQLLLVFSKDCKCNRRSTFVQ